MSDEERKPLLEKDAEGVQAEPNGYGAGEEVKVLGTKDEEKSKKTTKQAPFSKLFQYATPWDSFLMCVGSFFAAVHGAGWPVLSIVFGDMTNEFIGGSNSSLPTNATNSTLPSDYGEKMTEFMLRYIYIGVAVYVASFFQVTCWVSACERQTHKMKLAFFKAILRQDIGWFDEHQSGELSNRLADDLERVREGIGDKFGLCVQLIAAFLSGFAIGFWKGWKLTLVMISMTPLLAICGAFISKMMASFATKGQEAYAFAGGIAEEVLSCIRTVVSFCGQKKETKKYENALLECKKLGIKSSLYAGCGLCLTFIIMYGTYGLAFWFGSTQVDEFQRSLGRYGISPGEVLTVFFCVLIGSFSVGNAAPHFNTIATAKGGAAVLYEIIDNKPSIDSSSEEGQKPDVLKGYIQFEDVGFSYPTRPDIQVLKNFSISVEAGKTVALVGASGCGKSTVINLLQRFYDVSAGAVTIDNTDIRTLNIRWMRQQIGVVSQEPVLFGCTIAENIGYGREGVTEAEMIQAARMANAHDFITSLPKGYETMVGERGSQLSGGQKQRVAIARALVREPKILLLDEATAALDVESEKVVQDALDKARQGRTTIIVAHRLSTIQNADVIYALNDGQVAEIGTHQELMEKKGVYHQLVMLQAIGKDKQEEKADDLEEVKTPEGFKVKRHISRSMSTTRSTHEEETEDNDLVMPGFCRIFKWNLPELSYILLGLIGSAINGVVMPVFAIFFSRIIQVFTETGDQLKSDATLWSLLFVAFGFVTGFGQFISNICFGLSGERLTHRLRLETFRSMLGQDIAWFDDQQHSTGALTTRLSTDASMIRNATGIRVGIILQSVFGVVAGLVIAFIYGWKLALAILGMVPFLAIGGALQMKALTGSQKRDSKLLEGAGQIATESIENIRTVQSLTLESKMYATYAELLAKPYRESLKQGVIYGLSFGFAQSLIFVMYGGAFRFGAYLVMQNEMAPDAVYRVFFAIAFTGIGVGQASSFLPEYSKAKLAAAHILKIFQTIPIIGSYSLEGRTLTNLRGKIEFDHVHFKYPTRPDVSVLDGVHFDVEPGQTVALVGASGCGKSTIVSLLQRFYDPDMGVIKIDGVDIRDLNPNWLRSSISVVSQEPVLFNTSIRENITYGVEGEVNDDSVNAATELANIHDFIASLPEGYNTLVGEKGTQLSGGQKQRVAIARAMVCNPRILLLDEATSALDTESERVVQTALDRAREGRTCIVIAHRLSTIQNADAIAVMEGGRIIEMGSPAQLLAQKGAYYTLIKGQNENV